MLTHFHQSLEDYVPDNATIFQSEDGKQRAAIRYIQWSRWHGEHHELTIEGERYCYYRVWPGGEVRYVGHTGCQEVPTMNKAEQIRRLYNIGLGALEESPWNN